MSFLAELKIKCECGYTEIFYYDGVPVDDNISCSECGEKLSFSLSKKISRSETRRRRFKNIFKGKWENE